METPKKMAIRHNATEYEGIPAASAIGMALFESSGMRRLIDQRCRFDPEKRILSPGMVIKALIGPTYNIRNKYPLYLVNKAYTAAPTDRLFGPRVSCGDLYDTALARGLDTLFDCDLEKLFTACSDLAVKTFDLDSHEYHMDSTDISFWGMEHVPDKEGAAIPKHNGHPKDKRPELLQYELQLITNSVRIIRYMKPYSGNVSDSVMDRRTLEDMGRIFTPEELAVSTVVGDRKLATAGNIMKILDMNLGFVSKCAENFIGGAKRDAVDISLSTRMHSCGKRGLWMSDSDMDVALSEDRTEKLRFVAFRWDSKVDSKIGKLKEDCAGKAAKLKEMLDGMRFDCISDARECMSEKWIDPDGPLAVEFRDPLPEYAMHAPEGTIWRLDFDVLISDKRIRRKAETDSTVVLVTNLERPGKGYVHDGNGRAKATDERILELYSQEYVVEHSFRFMKSGIGMDSIFLQTPSRENAMMFVVCIAALITNIADAIFRRTDMRLDGRPLTMYRLAHELQTTLVTYSRSDNSLRLMGPREAAGRFFGYTDALRINPQYLLGYIGD